MPLWTARKFRRYRGDAVGEASHRIVELVQRNALKWETGTCRGRAVYVVAGVEQITGPLCTRQIREHVARRGGHVAHDRIAELGIVGADDEVTLHSELESAGEAPAIYLRDVRSLRTEEDG